MRIASITALQLDSTHDRIHVSSRSKVNSLFFFPVPFHSLQLCRQINNLRRSKLMSLMIRSRNACRILQADHSAPHQMKFQSHQWKPKTQREWEVLVFLFLSPLPPLSLSAPPSSFNKLVTILIGETFEVETVSLSCFLFYPIIHLKFPFRIFSWIKV